MDEEFERRMREAAEKMLRRRMPNGELPKVADDLPKGDGACIDVFRWTDEADMLALDAIDARLRRDARR